MRCAARLAACSLLLAGCAGTPAPDALAPVVLTDIAAPLDCPQPEPRRAPPELLAPLHLAAPAVLPAGQGDYGMTRAGLEAIIDALRAAGERLKLWEAWGG